MRLRSRRLCWPEAALIILLALLPALFFWRLITPNPADRMNIAAGDFTDQYFPVRAFTAGEWVSGRVPLWNPYLYGGQPALADIQSGALYPPHLAEALLLGWVGPLLLGRQVGFPVKALEIQVIAHFALAAVGTYLFARHLARQAGAGLRRARFSGVIASLVFTYGGYLTGFPVQQLTILEVSAWLPWVLWGVSLALHRHPPAGLRFHRESLAAAGWGAAAFGLALLAGHPQTVLYIFYLATAYTGLYLWQTWRAGALPPHGRVRYLVSLAAYWPGISLLGACLAAAQLLPTLEFIPRSLRADLSYQAVSAGLPLSELVSILYPGFLGGSPQYVGVVTLVLLGLALALGRPRHQVYFWAGLALLSLLLAFGSHTFLYSLFYLLAPGFAAVRQQERVLLIYSFSAAMLAGQGALVLTGPLARASRLTYARFEWGLRGLTLGAAALTGLFIYGSTAATARQAEVNLFVGVLQHHLVGLVNLAGMLLLLAWRPRRRLRRPGGMALIAFWLAFNLFTTNWRFNLAPPSQTPSFTPNEVTRFLQTNVPTFQPSSPSRIASAGLLPGGHSAASVYHLEDLTGNTPLQLASGAEFARQMPSWRYWQLLNVRYVVDKRDLSGPGLTRVFAEGGVQVFEVGDPFPRAWFVSEVEVVPQSGSSGLSPVVARLAADEFDLRRTAVIPAPLPTTLAEATAARVTPLAAGPTYLNLQVETTGPHLLVISQVYYPGWQAAIDGRPAELIQADGILQGLLVPAGAHTVVLTFAPTSFWLGSLLSIVAGIAWVGLMIMSAWKTVHR